LWGANAAAKAIFDVLNVIHENEKRSFFRLNLYSLALTLGGILVLMLAAGSVVVVPALLAALGIESLLVLLRWPRPARGSPVRARLSLPLRAKPHTDRMALGNVGQRSCG
jgi:hypothetical protein